MKAFQLSESFVQRACKKLETEGERGFFSTNSRKSSNHVIVESVHEQIQDFINFIEEAVS